MIGIIANRPMGRIRGKYEVNRPGKPKERGNRPNGPTWPVGPWNGKEMAGIGTQRAIQTEALVWAMPVSRRVMQAQKPKHAPHRRRQTQTVVALAQGLGHHLRVSSQYMGGEFSVKGFKGCDLVVGRKGIYSRVLVKTPFKKCLAG